MNQFIGRDETGARIFVSIRTEVTNRTVMSTDHVQVHNPVRLSIMGSLVEYRERSISRSGQIRTSVARVNTPAPGWTMADVESLVKIWDAYHVNDMRAGCAHMDTTGLRRDYESRKHLTCPETGYRYGAAWLFVAIPADALAEIERLRALPAGNVPAYV